MKKLKLVVPMDSAGVAMIAMERRRQVVEKGYTDEHDDMHDKGEFVQAAACYALGPAYVTPLYGHAPSESPKIMWPFEAGSYRPNQSRVRALVKAGAFLAAEIDRLLRREQAEIKKNERPAKRKSRLKPFGLYK
jgi:hypothetical protein